jgi:hypothetical protein
MAKSTTNFDSQLLSAVHKGSAPDIGRLLDTGADPNASDRYGLTALMRTARKGHTGLISLLCARGADLERMDRTGRTALFHAVGLKRAGTLKELITAGCKLNASDMHGWTALKLANSMDEYELSRILLNAGAEGDIPDPGDLSIGIVLFGPEKTPAFFAVNELQKQVAAARRPNPWGENGHLNVVFYLPGSLDRPSFQGIRTSTFSRLRRAFMTQASPVSAPDGTVDRGVLIEMVREAITLANERFRKAKIEFSGDQTRVWFDRLQS